MNYMKKCSCAYCNGDIYKVDVNSFARVRRRGVSGILRVKNDAEFLAESIDSCIDALDELIIVYNDCSDESPAIIKKKAEQYGNKIHYYEYEPKIYANNLTADEFNFIKSQPQDSPHLLSNYYNFALSKVNYEFVMKIDADQIYLTNSLVEICNAYRSDKKVFINPWKLFCFVFFYFNLIAYKKCGISILCCKKYFFRQYKRCLLNLINNYKISIYLSGYNVSWFEKKWYVPLGQLNEKTPNILCPYNGVTDHTIFRLTSETYFTPAEIKEYAQLNSHKYSLIETLCGLPIAVPYGFIWIHLNGVRRHIYDYQISNWELYRNRYMSFGEFIKTKSKNIPYSEDAIIFPKQNRLLYSLLHDSSDSSGMNRHIEKYHMATEHSSFYLKK